MGALLCRLVPVKRTDTASHSIIISTRDVAEGFPLEDFFTLLNVNGSFVTCGMPDKPYPPMTAQGMAANAAQFCGSHIGNKKECQQMLQMCADKGGCSRSPRETWSGSREADGVPAGSPGIKTWIEELPMSQASKAVQNVKDNKVRYRHVLKMDL